MPGAARRLGLLLPLGFASGLPLALSSGTLQAWLTVEGVAIERIGLFALAGLPYTLKFLWSPLLDRYSPPWLDRRRGWVLLWQGSLMLVLVAMALCGVDGGLWLLGFLALLLAFASASHDIVIDAYRTDLLPPPERGLGAALNVTGYRLGMLVSGALALILSDRIGWSATYLCMALAMSAGILATLTAPAPLYAATAPRSLKEAVVGPLQGLLARPQATALLAMIVLYKLGDAFAGTLTIAFLIRELGFSAAEVGVVAKGAGLVATLLGALGGGALLARIGLFRSLLWFGLLQAVTNLGFWALALHGKNALGMAVVVVAENLAGGMGTAAFVALLMALCDHHYSATQYALLSALAALGRVLAGPPAGELAAAAGWVWFFLLSFLVALPGLWL
ncbi:MAG: MFS transporter, partial [Gammaproteobacteria bacterium]